ncbi:MAG: SagB/ThcOx family dehydrogenase, partial [candidate division NC10 bacterium]|nr:SagB/ThcOx family dehydrogenase [candidate division NC10 bacterium]
LLGGGMISEATEISLPKPSEKGRISVEQAIQGRRTIRHFQDHPLTLDQLGQLLWAGQGITDKGSYHRRAAPSGGALYPLDLYAIVGKERVTGLKAGIYRYVPERHCLMEVSPGDRRESVARGSLGQMWMAEAPVIFAVVAEYQRITRKYGERGVRYALIEVGHVGQNLFLQAEALGLGAGIVGAFEDQEIASLLRCSPGQDPICLMPVGYKR